MCCSTSPIPTAIAYEWIKRDDQKIAKMNLRQSWSEDTQLHAARLQMRTKENERKWIDVRWNNCGTEMWNPWNATIQRYDDDDDDDGDRMQSTQLYYTWAKNFRCIPLLKELSRRPATATHKFPYTSLCDLNILLLSKFRNRKFRTKIIIMIIAIVMMMLASTCSIWNNVLCAKEFMGMNVDFVWRICSPESYI